MSLYIIYKICKKNSEKNYVGITTCWSDRKSYHKTHLNKNTHPNTYLQNSWNKYGEDAFEFKIIEKYKGTKEEAGIKEKYYIKKLKSHVKEQGYNLDLGGYRGNLCKETKDKLKNSLRKLQGVEVHQYDLEGNYVQSFNSLSEAEEETGVSRYLISQNITGKAKRTNRFIWSKKYKEKIDPYYKLFGKFDLNDNLIKVCYSQTEESKRLGVCSSGISKTLSGLYKTCGGYKWRWLNGN